MRVNRVPLAYFHPGDLELKDWVVILLAVGFVGLLIAVAFAAGFAAILKAIDRRTEKRKHRLIK